QLGTACRLLAPLTGDPGALARKGSRERLYLAYAAAALAQFQAAVEGVAAMELHIVRHRGGLRRVDLYLQRVALAYLVDQSERFGVQPPGVEDEDADRQARAGNRVREDHVLGLQTVCKHGGRMALRDLTQLLRKSAHARRRRKSGSGRFGDA